MSDDRPMETVQASRPVAVVAGENGVRMPSHGFYPGRLVAPTEPAPAILAGGLGSWGYSIEGSLGAALPDPTKPLYRVPSMAEIAALRGTNGLTVVSTFSGCGGSCLGFEMAGYRVLWASEFVPAAADTYRANHPGVPLDTRDIRLVTAEEVLAGAGVERGEVDVLEGSPPCASFSTAGKRSAGWGQVRKYSDTEQRVDDLFFEFIRLVDGVRPRVFVAENVSGLVKGVAKGYFKEILRAMRATGYRVEARLLDAQWLGVPQARQRIIFVGVRLDLELAPAFPKPLAYRYSLRDAIGYVVRQGDNGGYGGGAMRPAVQPSPTIGADASTGNGRYPAALVETPTERRKFSIAELRRVCGFPDDFQLTGSYAQQWERLGRAVPPPMMRAVAETIRDEIFDR